MMFLFIAWALVAVVGVLSLCAAAAFGKENER